MHRLLERQLKRILGADYVVDASIQRLLDVVDSYYHEAEQEQRVLKMRWL